MGCCWSWLRVWSRWKQGGEGEGLGFLREKHENPPFLLANIVVPGRSRLGLGQRGRAPKMGPIGTSPCSANQALDEEIDMINLVDHTHISN